MCKHKMDATPSFGVTKIPEVSSNPQLTIGANSPKTFYKKDLVFLFGSMYTSYQQIFPF